MKFFAIAVVTLLLLLIPYQTVSAQSASMPVPGLVVKDADGKVIGQVAGFHEGKNNDNVYPFIVLDVEGKLAYLYFRDYGLMDRVASESGDPGGSTVYFDNTNCVGNAFVNNVHPGSPEAWFSGVNFGVAGPDPVTGEYKLYRSTSMTPVSFDPPSFWATGSCNNGTYGGSADMLPAEEVIPNPLAGFHGPTDAQPERLLTVAGGDRIFPPTPTPIPTDTPTPPPPTATPTQTPIPLDCSDFHVEDDLYRWTSNASRMGLTLTNDTPYDAYLTYTDIEWSDSDYSGSVYLDRIYFEGGYDDFYYGGNDYSSPTVVITTISDDIILSSGDTDETWYAELNAGFFWVGTTCVQLDFTFPGYGTGTQTCSVSDCVTYSGQTPTPTPTP